MSINIHFFFLLKTSRKTLDLKLDVTWNLSNIHTAYNNIEHPRAKILASSLERQVSLMMKLLMISVTYHNLKIGYVTLLRMWH